MCLSSLRDNPEEFIIKAAALINDEKATAIIEDITYDVMDDYYGMRRFINFEFSNQYMLFLRNCDGLNVSDKSFKVLKLENNKITLAEEV